MGMEGEQLQEEEVEEEEYSTKHCVRSGGGGGDGYTPLILSLGACFLET